MNRARETFRGETGSPLPLTEMKISSFVACSVVLVSMLKRSYRNRRRLEFGGHSFGDSSGRGLVARLAAANFG